MVATEGGDGGFSVREVSRVDALTGLPTFAGLHSFLSEPAAAVFLDIDGFRLVNHHFGFRAGDEVLAGLGAWLKEETEAVHGLAFRVAGDEFILLLPGQTLSDAAAIANRLVSTCATMPWPPAGSEGSRVGITLSAVVFVADQDLPGKLRGTLDSFAEKLYQCEVASGRAHGNVVTAG